MAVNEEAHGDDHGPDAGEETFAIVGIGAAAEGVEAVRAFFDHLPDDSGMAFIVVQPLDPSREGELAKMLQRTTGMPVEQVVNRSEVVPNRVYVIPADKGLTMMRRTLRLTEPEHLHGQHAPIDRLFRSLAESQEERAICIVLSGTGDDGILGLKVVKRRGGITMMQQASEAPYEGMLQKASETGIVDFTLPIHELAEKLIAIRQAHPQVYAPAENGALADEDRSALRHIVAHLRLETGHDFSLYKRPTMLRRIARRMQLHQTEKMAVYLRVLKDQPGEVDALFRTLLINVTSFFRDTEAFEALTSEVIPKLFEGRTQEDTLRVWVPGCATGEEAYSVAMLLIEEAARHPEAPAMQVLATDPDREAIGYAREGLYPASIQEDVSPERLRRFFLQEAKGYRVDPDLREVVLFAEHDLLSDPPFSALDLVCCRNVLIYLQRGVQEDVLKLFHYTLKPEGYLFLGTSESVDAPPDLFSTLDRKSRLFQPKEASPQYASFPWLGMNPDRFEKASERARSRWGDPPEAKGFGALHRQALAELAPPSVLINEDYTILHVGNGAERFLRFPSGDPTQHLLNIVHDELQPDLRTVLFRASRKGEHCEKSVSYELEGTPRTVKLIARPVEQAEGKERVIQVLFQEQEPDAHRVANRGGEEQDEMIGHLERKLSEARGELSAILGEYKTTNEEFKASNEELQVMNEELQSTNQELEASKDELQVVNEDLAQVNSDLRNLMNSIELGILFLDRELCLNRYTPRVERLFNVIPSDRGRPLAHITSKIDYSVDANLVEDAQQVLDELKVIEREVCSEDDRWYLVRLLPYRTLDDKIDGVVITFLDITKRRQYREEITTRERQQSVVATLGRSALQEGDMQALMDRIVREVAHTLDVALCKILKYRPERQDLLLKAGVGWKDGYVGQATVNTDRGSQAGYTLITDGPIVVDNLQTEKRFEGPPLLDEHNVTSGMSVVIPGPDRPYGVLGAHTREQRSFTEQDAAFLQAVANALGPAIERRNTEEALRWSEERYRLIVENIEEYAICTLGTEGSVTSWNAGAENVLGYKEKEILGKPVALLFTEEDRADGVPEREMEIAIEEGAASDDRWQRRKDGSHFWASGIMSALYAEDGTLRGFVKILRDLTERKRLHDELEARAEERAKELRESEVRERAMLDALPDIVLRLSAEGVVKDAHAPDPGKLVVPMDEMTDQLILEVLPDHAANALENAFNAVLETGRQTNTEFTVHTQDGHDHTFEVRLMPIGDGVLMIERDVTERRQLEREILEITERERRRIAQELHDDLGQRLMGAQFLSRSLRRQLNGDESPHKEGVEEITEEINEAINYVRHLSHGLAAVDMSEGRGLDEALRGLAEHVARAFDVRCVYESEGSDQEDQTVATHLYRIAQEAVTNAVRHGNASEISIRRLADEEGLMLRVEDDGSGIPEEVLEGRGGLGLRSMRYRANLIQCRLSVRRRSEEGGTVVSCTRSRN